MILYRCPFCGAQGDPSSVLTQNGRVIAALECHCGAIGFRVKFCSDPGTTWFRHKKDEPEFARSILVLDSAVKMEEDE